VTVAPLVDHLFRRCAGRLVSSLTRALGSHELDLAEEVVQDALVRALQVWPYRGVPQDPEGWLHRVARNRALDVLRRRGRFEESAAPARLEALAPPTGPAGDAGDDELAMVFMCCHPALPFDVRIALTLRTVGGLSTDEIAAAFLTSRATVQQRIVRAKRAIAERGLSLQLPHGGLPADRRESVLAVLYLMFNEGYAATEGDALVRAELCGEAIRLARLLADHGELGGPEVDAFLALLLFQASRLDARAGDDGALALLPHQDRTRWDRARIAEGFHRLERATSATALTRWHLEAGIASGHAAAPSWEETEWPRILDLYDLLLEVEPSPVVALNRAVALAMARGPAAGLAALEGIDASALRGSHLLPAARGHLLALAGRPAEAAVEVRRALLACRSGPVRAYLERRASELERDAVDVG
jgi:RNA polymerase sigma-70 factor (ECF subfamily)